jgi:hypothetical protein
MTTGQATYPVTGKERPDGGRCGRPGHRMDSRKPASLFARHLTGLSANRRRGEKSVPVAKWMLSHLR